MPNMMLGPFLMAVYRAVPVPSDGTRAAPPFRLRGIVIALAIDCALLPFNYSSSGSDRRLCKPEGSIPLGSTKIQTAVRRSFRRWAYTRGIEPHEGTRPITP